MQDSRGLRGRTGSEGSGGRKAPAPVCADCFALAGTWHSTTLATRIAEALQHDTAGVEEIHVTLVWPTCLSPNSQHCPHALTTQFICQQNYARRSDYPT